MMGFWGLGGGDSTKKEQGGDGVGQFGANFGKCR